MKQQTTKQQHNKLSKQQINNTTMTTNKQTHKQTNKETNKQSN